MMNLKMRNILYVTAAAAALSACSGADNIASPGEGNLVIIPPAAPPAPPPPPPPPTAPTGGPAAGCPVGTANVGVLTTGLGEEVRNCQISGIITENLLIPRAAGTVYSLSGGVEIGVDTGTDGTAANGDATILTIEPGVTIFGSSGGDFLVVNRGSQIFAEGNVAEPIIFTSRANIDGTVGPDADGDWGGIVILGQAPISDCGTGGPSNPGGTRNDCEALVEGPLNAVFGGIQPADSSGRISFVQVRYPGFEVSPGNELNGITLAGVGSGTFFQNVQVHNSEDDGIEWFGGTVNARNLALTGSGDESVDTDTGFRGAMQYVLAVQRPAGLQADLVWEADSNGAEDVEPRQLTQIANFTFVSNDSDEVINLRGGGDYELYNGVVNSGAEECIDIDAAETVRAADASIQENGPPRFESIFFSCPTLVLDDGDISVTATLNIINGGTNNVTNGVSSLINSAASLSFINGANENAVTPFAVSAINSFFEDTTFIGAVQDANDTRFQGWTCSLYVGDTSCFDTPVIG